jgi:menaquinone-dependent protoporphyrinogen oxidase
MSTSRRQFLKIAGVTLAASTLTCSGAGYLTTRQPEINIPDATFGKDTTMTDRILITYATRAGSTAEIAVELGKSLSERGFTADVKPVKDKPNLDNYSAVIIGSAIRMGKWLPEAVQFIEDNQQTLNQKPVATFTVHMLNSGDDETSRANRMAYLDNVRPLLNGAEEVYFEGKFDFSKLSFADKLIAKMVKAEERDERDWEAIRDWAPAILEKV